MATLKQNKTFVYLYWEEPKEGYKDNDSYAPDLFLLDLGAKHFFNKDEKVIWEEAAEYTRLRLKEIEQVEEQLDWLNHYTADTAETDTHKKARIAVIECITGELIKLKRGLNL